MKARILSLLLALCLLCCALPAVAAQSVQLPGMVSALLRIRDHFMITGYGR